jgi:hypothetical protein
MAGSIFCDFEKAFDSINHDILLSKLPYYGIRGKAKLLLKTCLVSTIKLALKYLQIVLSA